MKKLLLILSLMAASSLPSQAENRIVTDTVDGKKRVIELQDNVVDGQNVTDTLSITTYEGKREPTVTKIEKEGVSIEIKDDGEYLFGLDRNLWNMAIIPIVAIVFVFGLPALLILIRQMKELKVSKNSQSGDRGEFARRCLDEANAVYSVVQDSYRQLSELADRGFAVRQAASKLLR